MKISHFIRRESPECGSSEGSRSDSSSFEQNSDNETADEEIFFLSIVQWSGMQIQKNINGNRTLSQQDLIVPLYL